MSVELALGTFPAWVPHVPLDIAGACELHARGFDSAAAPCCLSRSMEGLA